MSVLRSPTPNPTTSIVHVVRCSDAPTKWTERICTVGPVSLAVPARIATAAIRPSRHKRRIVSPPLMYDHAVVSLCLSSVAPSLLCGRPRGPRSLLRPLAPQKHANEEGSGRRRLRVRCGGRPVQCRSSVGVRSIGGLRPTLVSSSWCASGTAAGSKPNASLVHPRECQSKTTSTETSCCGSVSVQGTTAIVARELAFPVGRVATPESSDTSSTDDECGEPVHLSFCIVVQREHATSSLRRNTDQSVVSGAVLATPLRSKPRLAGDAYGSVCMSRRSVCRHPELSKHLVCQAEQAAGASSQGQ